MKDNILTKIIPCWVIWNFNFEALIVKAIPNKKHNIIYNIICFLEYK